MAGGPPSSAGYMSEQQGPLMLPLGAQAGVAANALHAPTQTLCSRPEVRAILPAGLLRLGARQCRPPVQLPTSNSTASAQHRRPSTCLCAYAPVATTCRPAYARACATPPRLVAAVPLWEVDRGDCTALAPRGPVDIAMSCYASSESCI